MKVSLRNFLKATLRNFNEDNITTFLNVEREGEAGIRTEIFADL
jgi:molybdopterin-binding protein